MWKKGRTIEADRLVLKTPDGRTCAILNAHADGSCALSFLDKTGRPRVVLGVAEDGSPELTFIDAQGSPRAGLSVAVDSSPSLALIDGKGNIRLGVSVSAEGTPELLMSDGEERTRALIGVAKDEKPYIHFFDEELKPERVQINQNRSRAKLDANGARGGFPMIPPAPEGVKPRAIPPRNKRKSNNANAKNESAGAPIIEIDAPPPNARFETKRRSQKVRVF